MLCITRLQARVLRTLFRRSVLGFTTRGPGPALTFQSDERGLRARAIGPHVALEYRISSDASAQQHLLLPLDALADIEGRDDSTIALDNETDKRTKARWDDHGIPVTRTYDIPDATTPVAFPSLPSRFVACSSDVIEALAAASEITGDDSPRYALDSIEIRGEAGEVAATDGHQLLVRSQLDFPWTETLLIRHTPIFAIKNWVTNSDLTFGRTDTHIVFRSSAWTIAIAIRTNVRFPKTSDVIPADTRTTTRLKLDPDDALFLANSLGRLPGDDTMNSPVTLDLNGKVRVRAVDAHGTSPTELVLTRSDYTGTPVRVSINRNFLAFAARSGATNIRVHGASAPLTAESPNSVYAWQPLDGVETIAPAADAVAIDSTSYHSATPVAVRPSPSPRILPMKPTPPPTPAAPATTTGLATLIAEAEAIHTILADARTRSGRLVTALRRHRKQSRLVQDTLRSLHQLKLHDVAG